jgi:hypothetical protein
MASLRAASVIFSVGFCIQANQIGLLNMLLPILKYVLECPHFRAGARFKRLKGQ